jgi:hypothetical protein
MNSSFITILKIKRPNIEPYSKWISFCLLPLTNCVKLNYLSRADNWSATEDIPKIKYCVHKSSPSILILTQTNLIHTF